MKLGNFDVNKIYVGDSRELIKLLPDNSIDLLVTDPPYFIPTQSYVGTREDGAYKRRVGDTSILTGYFSYFLEDIDRVLKPTASTYIFCDAKSYPSFFQAMFPFYKHVRLLVWDKMTSYNGYTWRHQHELIAWGERDESPRIPTGDGDILRFRGVPQKDRLHEAEKPVEVVTRLIEKHTEAEIVLDPFCGSAPVGEACIRLGKKFIGFEVDNERATVAERRLANAPRPLIIQQVVEQGALSW